MNIVVERQWYTQKSTIGKMYINGVYFCFTLEPAYHVAPVKPRLIEEGAFRVELLPSTHFGCIVPHVMDVPDFVAVEIHWGNFPCNTDACTLVGDTMGEDYIGNSKATWQALMEQFAGHKDESHTIRYTKSGESIN